MRFAIIGSNFIAEWFVAAAKQCTDVVLQTVYSRTEAQAKINAEKWDVPTACWSLEALAEDKNVDAVYISSPNACHCTQVEPMLLAGKHVLCEKPIVPCEKQLYPLLDLAEKQGVLLLEAMRPAYLPVLETLREVLPKLGALRYALFSYAQYSSRYDRYKEGIIENAFDPTLCNGTLIDIGVYCVHWMAMLFGEPQSIRSLASFLDDSIDVSGSALCDYGTLQVHLHYSKVHQTEQPAVIEGENGYVTLAPFPIPAQLQLHLRGEKPVTVPLTRHERDIQHEIERFVDMARQPSLARPYQEWSLSALRIMDTIRAQCGIDFVKRKH